MVAKFAVNKGEISQIKKKSQIEISPGPLTNSLMTKWSMDDVSLSPWRNVGICRTHWATQENINREK